MSFSLNLKVRDYECDMQGIVNNAIYQHYLEHARHEYLLSHGLSFAEMTRQGIVIVVVGPNWITANRSEPAMNFRSL